MCQCRFNKSNIDEESFAACNDHFSEYVTFRARLSGTADNDSEYLVSLLAKWVSTSPKISVDRLEMKVTNNELNCTVFLSGHNDRDCVSELSRNSNVELAVILPSVFGILVAAIGAIAAIVLAVLALMRRKGTHKMYSRARMKLYVFKGYLTVILCKSCYDSTV